MACENVKLFLREPLVRLLEIIGEATRGLSDDFRTTNPEIPWRKMVGMRDRLIHGYFDVDVEVVWKTVTSDLPGLVSRLERLFSTEEDQEKAPK